MSRKHEGAVRSRGFHNHCAPRLGWTGTLSSPLRLSKVPTGPLKSAKAIPAAANDCGPSPAVGRKVQATTMGEVHKCQRALPQGGGLLIINAKTRAKGVPVLAANLFEAVRGTSNTAQTIRRASKCAYIVSSYHLGRAPVEG